MFASVIGLNPVFQPLLTVTIVTVNMSNHLVLNIPHDSHRLSSRQKPSIALCKITVTNNHKSQSQSQIYDMDWVAILSTDFLPYGKALPRVPMLEKKHVIITLPSSTVQTKTKKV